MDFLFQFASVSASAAPLTGHSILTITNDGVDKPLVTTALAHGLLVDTSVTISGTTDYNGTFLASPDAADTFVLTDGAYTNDNTGGRWD